MTAFLPKTALDLLQYPDSLLGADERSSLRGRTEDYAFLPGRHGRDVQRDKSPLTAADRASHCFLLQALRDITPGFDVVSEESVENYCGSLVGGKSCWIVDPHDGTKEFIKVRTSSP